MFDFTSHSLSISRLIDYLKQHHCDTLTQEVLQTFLNHQTQILEAIPQPPHASIIANKLRLEIQFFQVLIKHSSDIEITLTDLLGKIQLSDEHDDIQAIIIQLKLSAAHEYVSFICMNDIQTSVNQRLSCILDTPVPESLHEKLIHRYTSLQLMTLSELFENQAFPTQHERIQALKEFMTETWHKTKENMLCYTAMPNAEMTAVHIQVSTYLAINDVMQQASSSMNRLDKQAKLLELMIQNLMPGINFECNTAPPFGNGHWGEVSIEQLLRTHILKEGGEYLVPVSSMAAFDSHDVRHPHIPNIYAGMSLSANEHDYFLSEDDTRRLINHSPLTRAVYDIKQSFNTIASDKNNLLGKLNELIPQLYDNSANGTGTEESVGSGGIRAIVSFVHYFKNFHEDATKTLSPALMVQIRLLHHCIGEYNPGEKSIAPIESCFNTRRTELLEAMRGQEEQLLRLTISKETTASNIAETQQELTHAMQHLSHAIQTDYPINANDNFGLTYALLTSFSIDVHFSNFDNLLALLKPLSVSEIQNLLQNSSLKTEATTCIHNLDNYVTLALELPPLQLETFAQLTQEFLHQKLILNVRHLSSLLVLLDAEKTQMFIRILAPHLDTILRQGAGLFDLLQKISQPQQIIVRDTLNESGKFDTLIIKAIRKNGMALQYASEALKNNRDLVLAAVLQRGGKIFQYASTALKEDHTYVLSVIQQSACSFKYASKNLKTNREFVLAALAINGIALQYVSKAFRNDKDVVLAAMKQNRSAIQFASVRLQNTPNLTDSGVATFFSERSTQEPEEPSYKRSRHEPSV